MHLNYADSLGMLRNSIPTDTVYNQLETSPGKPQKARSTAKWRAIITSVPIVTPRSGLKVRFSTAATLFVNAKTYNASKI